MFNILGYEFCAIVTLCISFAAAHVAITEIQVLKKKPELMSGSPKRVVFDCLIRSLFANVILLIVPLVIILLNSLRVKNCDYSEGLLFYLILPVLSCLAVTAAGVFFGLLIEKRWFSYLSYVCVLLLSLIPVITNLIFHPPVFAYHPILGYFPGPIYDFVISITDVLLFSRTETLVLALLFTSVSIMTCEIGRGTGFTPKLNWRKLNVLKYRKSVWNIAVVYLLFISIVSFEVFAGKIGIRPSRSDIEQALGGFRETEHFKIYYSQDLEEDIDLFADDCEFQYSQLSVYMQSNISRKVRAYLYSSPEQKKRLIGAGNTYVEDPFGYGFHLHVQGFPHPVLKHELAHVFTADWSPWKVSLKVGIHEGIAVAADWDEGKLTVHQWAKAMRELNVAPSLSSVIGLGFWRHAGSRSYLLAGSFIRFLVDEYGIDMLKDAFPTGNLTKVYGKDLAELEQEWVNHLSDTVLLTEKEKSYAERRLRRGGIFEQVCAHEMASLREKAWNAYYRKDYNAAVTTFKSMLSHEPDNPLTLRGLMYSTFQAKDYDLSESYSRQLMERQDSSYKAEVSLLLGDIKWLNDNVNEALILYEDATSYAPRDSTLRRILSRIASLNSRYTQETQDLLRDVLLSVSSDGQVGSATKMALLHQIIDEEPEEWLAYYLIAELLYKERSWDLSIQYLNKVLELNQVTDDQAIHPELLFRTQWLLGMSYFYQKYYGTAAGIFAEIADNESLHKGTKLSARYWVDRCQ
ncbi:hypothetical protein F4X73_04710, partial [Candidatus Poribacteria bacterium]|nr:hypothetical protein [Candidatus Poribacteria bacterium]